MVCPGEVDQLKPSFLRSPVPLQVPAGCRSPVFPCRVHLVQNGFPPLDAGAKQPSDGADVVSSWWPCRAGRLRRRRCGWPPPRSGRRGRWPCRCGHYSSTRPMRSSVSRKAMRSPPNSRTRTQDWLNGALIAALLAVPITHRPERTAPAGVFPRVRLPGSTGSDRATLGERTCRHQCRR